MTGHRIVVAWCCTVAVTAIACGGRAVNEGAARGDDVSSHGTGGGANGRGGSSGGSEQVVHGGDGTADGTSNVGMPSAPATTGGCPECAASAWLADAASFSDAGATTVLLVDAAVTTVLPSDAGQGFDARRAQVDSGSHKRIAFSRGGGNGNLGGLVGADRICQAGALSGTWKAWLSDATTNAIDRIADVGPWYTMDGRLAFRNKAQLMETPSAVIEYDQFESIVAASSYWTGTHLGGTSTDANCDNWTSAAPDTKGVWGDGRQLKGAATWTEAIYPPSPCNGYINLLCIEQ